MSTLLNAIAIGVLGFYGLIAATSVILIIYLIFRRIRIKKQENFEDRDN